MIQGSAHPGLPCNRGHVRQGQDNNRKEMSLVPPTAVHFTVL